MSNADTVSMVLAGLALVLAASVAYLIYLSPQHRGRFGRRTQVETRPVMVRLVPSAGTGLGYWWRFQTPADATPTTVDIFSFRSNLAAAATPWQHELMDAPLTLQPGEVAHLRAPALATAGSVYDVSVGWTVPGPHTDVVGSAILKVAPEPYG